MAITGRVKTANGLLNKWPLGPSSLMGRTLDENFEAIDAFMNSGVLDPLFSVGSNGIVKAPTQDDVDNNRILKAANGGGAWIADTGGLIGTNVTQSGANSNAGGLNTSSTGKGSLTTGDHTSDGVFQNGSDGGILYGTTFLAGSGVTVSGDGHLIGGMLNSALLSINGSGNIVALNSQGSGAISNVTVSASGVQVFGHHEDNAAVASSINMTGQAHFFAGHLLGGSAVFSAQAAAFFGQIRNPYTYTGTGLGSMFVGQLSEADAQISGQGAFGAGRTRNGNEFTVSGNGAVGFGNTEFGAINVSGSGAIQLGHGTLSDSWHVQIGPNLAKFDLENAQIGFFSAVPVVQPASADQAALGAATTVGTNTGTPAAGLSLIGDTATVDQSAALMNDLASLRRDIANAYTLINALRLGTVNLGLLKGAA